MLKVKNKQAYQFELDAWQKNELIFGIDEVGRGCLAGPVIACCAVLNPFASHDLLVDSKILSENNLIKASQWIKLNSLYAFGIIDTTHIDELNIYKATQLAMKRAFYGLLLHPLLQQKPVVTLIDAVPLDLLGHYKVESFTKGESKSVSIAAASILAKTYRDELMILLGHRFPAYQFSSNKGYGTTAHQEGILNQGISLLHRKTFLSPFIGETAPTNTRQQQIF